MANNHPQERPAIPSTRDHPPAERPASDEVARRMAILLDDLVRIPGTRLRFGIDPILSLVPFWGEGICALLGVTLLARAGRRGVPVGTMARMLLNIGINAVVGLVPVIGDAFSFWFKSNRRNYQLMMAYEKEGAAAEKRNRAVSLLFALVAVGIVVAQLLLFAAVAMGFLSWLF